jgi:hypothetical protein
MGCSLRVAVLPTLFGSKGAPPLAQKASIGVPLRQPIVAALRPSVFDRKILTLDMTGFFQAVA